MKRHIIILLVVLLVLLAAVFFVNRSASLGPQTAPETSLLSLTRDDIAAFRIENFTEAFEFKKAGEDWLFKRVPSALSQKIEDAEGAKAPESEEATAAKDFGAANAVAVKADPVKVSTLLTSLTTARAGAPVATEKDSVPRFQINPHSLNVTLNGADGKDLGRIFVGKAGPNFLSNYVKTAASDAVYLVDVNLQGVLGYNYDQWRAAEDKTESKNGTSEGKKER